MVGNVAHMNSAHPCPPPQAGERAMRKCPQRSLCGSAALRSRGFWVQFHAGGNSTADLRRSPYTSCPAVSFLILLEAFIASQNASLICNHCPIIPVHFRFSFSVLTVLPPPIRSSMLNCPLMLSSSIHQRKTSIPLCQSHCKPFTFLILSIRSNAEMYIFS